MKIAVLPFNAAEGTKQAYGRQFAAFMGDQLRTATQTDVNTISFLAQVETEIGPRIGFVNISEGFLAPEQLNEMAQQTQVELIVDGTLKEEDGSFDMAVRFHRPGEVEPYKVDDYKFVQNDLFKILHTLVKRLAEESQVQLPAEMAGETMEFGTDDAEAMLNFFEGYDGFNYVQQAQGRVVQEFDPNIALNAFLKAIELDNDFVAPYEVICEYARMLANYQIGNYEDLLKALDKTTQLVPDEFRAYFALGELYGLGNQHAKAAELFEKAVTLAPEEAALVTRLGMAQMNLGMPVNAERNFRKAIEMEGDDKPSMDYLAAVLQQTGRGHEIPQLWKELVDQNPGNAQVQVKYAISLVQNEQLEAGEKAFEDALEASEDNTLIKRYYAPLLSQKGDLDRAMDFFEDCLDVAPNDIELMLEYAQTLQKAGRDFEVPQVLKNVLSSNPDPNTRAQTLAWLIEMEQSKRVENVMNAQKKIEEGDFEGAIRDLRPLKNWLADYWKMWALLAQAHNRLNQPEEAEDAAKRLIDLFPACEPGYAELASALNSQERHEEAYNLMRFAAATLPQSIPVHINLGLAAKRAGHPDEARALAQQLREAIGPNEELEPVFKEMES